ncbi:MAG TPA: hypothetical protein VFV67_00840 [Actinophytocola sp.]|uniref:hypothetical protein n=1 Tax=Actinophytocola sp. TaxID=1872138 RepID=UPI002DBE4866|nr:hypothetical protein [Actinophytocola sp.]HEU5469169.1 hypothetical protein [Actinophytocola sp.]
MSRRRLVRASRLLPLILSVAVAGTGAACSGPDAPEATAPQSPDPIADLRSPGTVLVLHCDQKSLTLTALSSDDGHQVATITAARVSDGGPSYLCGDPLTSGYPSTGMLQQLLAPDAARLAGWARGPGDEGFLATAYDTRTGAQVGPGLDPDDFAASPEDSRPVFHDGKLWYVDRDKRLRSRSTEQPPEAAEDHGPAGALKVIFAGDSPWYGQEVDTTAVHPSGRYAAEFDGFWGNLRIRERDASRNDVVVLSEALAAGAEKPPPGSAPLPPCRPNYWLDDATMVCSSQSQIWRLTLAPDHGSVSKAEPLLPDTDRQTYGPVPAPDKRAFAFLAEQGDTTAVYRQALSSGAQPTKLADIPEFAEAYLIGWS